MYLLVSSLGLLMYITEQSAKGTFIRKNPTLVKLLRKLKINNETTWSKILKDGGISTRAKRTE